MKLTLEFNSMEEFYDELAKIVSGLHLNAESAPKAVPFEQAVDHAALNASAKKTTEIINKAEAKTEETVAVITKQGVTVVDGEKAEEIAEKVLPKEKRDVLAKDPEPVPEVDESYRLEVRRALSKLNAIAKQNGGGKPAQELVKKLGFDKLSDVTLEKLPELMKMAKEALDGGTQ